MKQERLERSLEWINRLMDLAETTPNYYYARGNGRSLYLIAMFGKTLHIYRPIRHALQKAIEKPVRMDGNRAFCPDCGTGVKKKDNYCRICGQRLAARQQDGKKPFYMVFDEKHYYGR